MNKQGNFNAICHGRNTIFLSLATPDYGEPAKITAFQVCAQLGDAELLPDARKVVISGDSVPLKISAIAYIGLMGGASDVELLKKYLSGTEIRLRVPAKAALKRLAAAGIKEGETR